MYKSLRLHRWAVALFVLVLFTACRKEAARPAFIPSATPAVTGGSSDLVITPAGLMPRSNVHYLPQDHFLSFENGRIKQFEKATNRLVADFGEVKVVPTQAPQASEAQGWIAYAYWTNTGAPISRFTTNWTVPSAPVDQGGGQTIFLFNGMQDGTTATSYIIQPVLQWGPSAAGGGNYWAVTSWFVTTTQAFFGDLITVKSGRGLRGVIKKEGGSGKTYNYSSSFQGLPGDASLTVRKVPQAFWAAETLESYGVTNPSTMYPPNTDIAMTGIQIQRGSKDVLIDWLTAQAVSGSAQKAVVVSDSNPGGVVDLYFR
jgi:hypothetical protein